MRMRHSQWSGEMKPICPLCKEAQMQEAHNDLAQWKCYACETTFIELGSNGTFATTDDKIGKEVVVKGPGLFLWSTMTVYCDIQLELSEHLV